MPGSSALSDGGQWFIATVRRVTLHDTQFREGALIPTMSKLSECRTKYACGLLRDVRGAYVLQLRPANATHAANLLTCFGGRCEPGETAEECLARELHEELGWQPRHIPPATVYLRNAGHLIATFHPLVLPADITLRTEPGFVAVAAPPVSLPGLPISPWHRLVLRAISLGGSLPITVTLAAPTAPSPLSNR